MAETQTIPPKAYSYLRFSTPEQSKGDSFRRQTEMARAYCLRHSLELDTELTFQDLGVSAYRGANSETGKLSEFLVAVQGGAVPVGSYLLVEGLDRLSRLVPRKALRVLEDIVDQGITVVTLNDGRIYTKETLDGDGGLNLIVALMVFMRANEESATKGRRVAAAWAQKRKKVLLDPNASYTKQLPFWLTSRWEVDEERVGAIRDIYRLYADGWGHVRIKRYLDERYKPVKAAVWGPTMVKKMLLSRAVEGHLRVNSGELLENIFPAVVDAVIVAKVRALQATTVRAGRATVDSAGQSTSTESTTVHPYAGLLRCSCGATAIRVNKGKLLSYLVCAAAKEGRGCMYSSFPYKKALALLDYVSVRVLRLWHANTQGWRAKIWNISQNSNQAWRIQCPAWLF